MFSPCICGSSHLQDDEDDMDVLNPSSTPKRSKKSNNPYANRGLDKFSALLADLEGMKQKIYTQMGSDQISFVHFAFSNSNNAVVIILILALLAIYGRSFAVMCTSIGWYVIPTIRQSSSSRLSSRKQKRKKDYSRKLSCKTVVSTNISDGSTSPNSVLHGRVF